MSELRGVDRKEGLWGNGAKGSRISHAMVCMIDFMRHKKHTCLIQLLGIYLSGPDQNLTEANISC